MKNLVTRMLSAGLVMASVVALHAQTRAVTANVPFDFYIGRTVMPKGVYRVSELQNGALVSLRSANAAKAVTATQVIGKSVEEQARLVFHRYGDTYFLIQVWADHESLGRAIARTPREKELSAKVASPGDTVVVALAQ
jgi:hypothetical protein